MGEANGTTNTQTKKKSVTKVIVGWIAVFLVIGLAFYLIVYYEGPYPWEKPPEVESANVELYRFSDLTGWNNETNETLNVEIWLKNTGEEIAREISLFIRVRDQNGNIKYMDLPDITWELLGENETCSAIYIIDYEPGDTYVEHTIEVRWNTGMNSYLKETKL